METDSGAPRKLPNSTSSLYIDSTIAKPDMVELCFCVSIVVYDLIVDAEAALAARASLTPKPPDPQAPSADVADVSDGGEGSSGVDPKSDPYSLFRPREIFRLPSKRTREEFEAPRNIFEGIKDVCGGPDFAETLAKVPTEEDIRSAIADVHATANFTPGCLVVALIYIERLRRVSGAMLLASTWQPTLLISILVAQKVWEDRAHMNVDFTPLCPELTLQGLNRLERDFLRLLDYNVGVKAAVYTNWYFRLGTLCERNSMRMRPLDSREAGLLEIGSDRFATRIRSSTPQRPHSGPLPTLDDSIAGDQTPSQRTRAVLS